ncbi:MAG: PIN domain-containing protein [Verrucomicrobia subdivision 3 bacterium]|nr:PIN domain-containing protein [Limisphaerales bacterium]
MIHLDTNYLIGLAVAGSPEAQRVDQWLAAGESVAASALAWTEFLNGPVQPHEITLVESVIESRVVPFDKATRFWLPSCLTRPGDGAVRGSTA